MQVTASDADRFHLITADSRSQLSTQHSTKRTHFWAPWPHLRLLGVCCIDPWMLADRLEGSMKAARNTRFAYRDGNIGIP
jgi:hypothetical protein